MEITSSKAPTFNVGNKVLVSGKLFQDNLDHKFKVDKIYEDGTIGLRTHDDEFLTTPMSDFFVSLVVGDGDEDPRGEDEDGNREPLQLGKELPIPAKHVSTYVTKIDNKMIGGRQNKKHRKTHKRNRKHHRKSTKKTLRR